MDEPATIRLLNPLETTERIPARLVDISRAGMKLRLAEPLMPGTLLQVRLQSRLALGEIRHSEPAGDDFCTGLRLQDVIDTSAA